ncbi:nicotinic acid mononucleotide adenyltransferase [Psychroserpens sp.]|uniref:nicotinic acid mononucleotide adenyltransferase n=1 Tax=Psychroserpens sp. TaxID=2020870 RepID=UPI001B25281B|nr:nicotinic acid mononucleotide adenyltransferase [Psychroserpens sp.]MBO6607709.1 nicotinic acid mononucleotide adenyltransferase [Psychroserpens sp.]MBO6631095.1 nicotinic acid mononucleotide adenyltransferase [Psychroserpens sp.]MBO6654700.1 nicotinic acid mononucleotide adenyltransferase [Psychroserpens sp.]MBO6682876.1 nicotinic acid mononucleotide adenyltransferase [Psychroserpens sp.]MBO6751067.1 nicotinic acid mononucleotide adenyltransferase [Psychroserpens sp.]
MKTIKLLLVFAISATLFTSCYTEDVIITDVNNNQPGITLNQLLSSYELWYVDINQTLGPGETPFLQIAFTVSFRNGVLFANNNLVGFGSQGNGFGIDVGTYDAYGTILDVYHDIDGYQTFDVYQIDNNTIELYNPFNDTSYFLNGYQRSNFDYDFVFYDNIHYFLQEYEAWEKTFTSEMGVLNEFDNENYLQFLPGGNDSVFRSSQDVNISDPANIYWDYTGVYGVGDISGNMYLKTLTLDYDFFDNEFFELSVINDQRIELYHPSSETIYEFTGRGYIQFLRQTDAQGNTIEDTKKTLKKRKQKTPRLDNPRENTRS